LLLRQLISHGSFCGSDNLFFPQASLGRWFFKKIYLTIAVPIHFRISTGFLERGKAELLQE